MSSKIFKSPLPYLALLAAHLIWGGNFVVAKITLNEFPAMSLGFARFAFACLLLIPFLLTLKNKQALSKNLVLNAVKPKDFTKLILAAVLMATLTISLFYEGIKRTTAIDASVLSLTIPMLSVLGGWWILKEKIFFVNLIGVALGLLGAIVIIGLPLILVGKVETEALFGNLLLILSSVCFVTGSIISKKLLETYPPLIITSFLFVVGAVSFFIPAIFEYIQNPTWPQGISILGVIGFLYITVLSSVCAFFLLIWGLKKTSVTQANLFQYIEPAVAATLASIFLQERISFSFIIGTCLIVLGVYWGTMGKAEHHHLHHKSHRS